MASLSVIIPTCNRNDLLELCLYKLLYSIKCTNIFVDIIISDDSPQQNAKLLIECKFHSVQWVAGPQKGPAANRNNGAKHAKGQWLIFLDDDCLPDTDLIQSYLRAINRRRENQFVFEGKIIADRDQKRFNEEAPININGGRLWSCNFCIESTLFNNIGQFDERFPFPSMEDADLHERLSKNHEIIFVENAFVVHPWREVGFFKNFKKRLVSYRFFVKKHYPNSMISFRVSRVKIFAHGIIANFIQLAKFGFKGTLYYFEICLFNFTSIFL